MDQEYANFALVGCSHKKASKRGLILMNVSQCPGGKVLMGHYETSIELQKRESSVAKTVLSKLLLRN